ncbi:MAG: alpha/beta hydrolase [Promethearchaeota archaeon]
MKVTNEMIDRELRFMGRIMKFFFNPTKKFLSFVHKFALRSKGKNIKGFQCSEEFIPSRDNGRKIRVRIFAPKSVKLVLPGILYLHGGGYMMLTPESSLNKMKYFLDTRDCVIVVPDYRVSLEEPYPAALNDCYDTLEWMVKNAELLNFNPNQVFTIGESAGGGLTAVVTLLARDLGKIHTAYQMPLYPMIDYRMQTDSMKENDAPVWSEKHNKLAWELYLDGVKEGDITSYASPALSKDYTNLPPASTLVGEVDPIRDETVEYFKNLETAGVEVRYKIFKGAYHGFEDMVQRAKVSKLAVVYIKENFRYAVDHYFAEQQE